MPKLSEKEIQSVENELTSNFRNKWLPRFIKAMRDSDEKGGYDTVDLNEHDFSFEFLEWMQGADL